MPLYEYKGLNGHGKQIKGVKEAASKAALRDALLKTGIYLSEAKEKSGSRSDGEKKSFNLQIGTGVSKQDIKDFTSQFCTRHLPIRPKKKRSKLRSPISSRK